ncbi:MAG: trypsin-like serine protease [Elusimicrobiota bacterium]|nr:trypsin-like serine protease [Elusimicrobiota bacterium]
MRSRLLAALLAATPAASSGYVGPVVDAARFPSTVYLELDRGGAETQRCTGVVIGPRAVLTAAHCLGDVRDGRWACILRDRRVMVGRAGTTSAARTVARVAVHPSVTGYSRGMFHMGSDYAGLSDAAVLIFNESLGLPGADLADSVSARQEIFIGGHGQPAIDARSYSDDLRMGARVVNSINGVQFEVRPQPDTGFLLHGDSGGPAYDLAGRVVGVNSFIRPGDSVRVISGTREYSRYTSYLSNISRADVMRAWVGTAEQGAASVACPFPRLR